MQLIHWNRLTQDQQRAALRRPARDGAASVGAEAQLIIDEVRSGGDAALRRLSGRFDGVELERLEVGPAEFAAAEKALSVTEHAAIERAIDTVRQFHAAQLAPPIRIETAPGVLCERIQVPIRAVGLYVPAGSAPLPSSAIMLAVPAVLAGCPERILCTPPTRSGSANAAVLVAARKAGAQRCFKVGGAQAVAAMAYGTQSIAKCDKIFGPGNAYVTAAKLLVAQDPDGAAADLPAGVTEVMVIADETARADFVASDLLAQAEHSTDAQAILLTTSSDLAAAVAGQIERQRAALKRTEVLDHSIKSIRLVVVDSLKSAFRIANDYAPEHLLMELAEARAWLPAVSTAGAVFLGSWSPESMGDYCSGPNHTLPTYGYARAYSGLAVEDFQRRMSVQELSREGLKALGPTAQILAGLEGLDAHAAAVTVRLEAMA
ncbi:MAG TPA: histidinol dehydrogenase [Steroidobacteraceae bacterium]|jgi:histidinol dehydrogenase